jgi:hypothetical protein
VSAHGRGLRRLRLTVERLQQRSAVCGMGLGGHIAEQQYSAMNVRFSNRPVRVKRFKLSTTTVRCRSRARASLRNRHKGPSIMGFEDEAEQSLPRPCLVGRSKRTCELTSSIVPRGTAASIMMRHFGTPYVARRECCPAMANREDRRAGTVRPLQQTSTAANYVCPSPLKRNQRQSRESVSRTSV